MDSMTVSEARAALPDLLNRVDAGEEITITRHGRPVAVVVRPDALRSRRMHALLAETKHVHDVLADARSKPQRTSAGLTEERAEELVREIRADRDSR